MARAFSTSVFEPLVIAVAVSCTMPSVGRSLVDRRKWSRSAWFSFDALPGAERSTAIFFVATRLVTVRTGGAPAGNSAAMMPSESVLVLRILAVPPSTTKLLDSVFWNGVRPMSAAGTHMRVVPEGFKTSTRVVTSNVRQPLGVTSMAKSESARSNGRLADTIPADQRKSRRFMCALHGSEFTCLHELCVPGAEIILQRLRRRVQGAHATNRGKVRAPAGACAIRSSLAWQSH